MTPRPEGAVSRVHVAALLLIIGLVAGLQILDNLRLCRAVKPGRWLRLDAFDDGPPRKAPYGPRISIARSASSAATPATSASHGSASSR